jgi:hypothetical protein
MVYKMFYAVKGCFNLLGLRSQIGLAPSAHSIPFLQGVHAVASRATASGTQFFPYTRVGQHAPKALVNSVSATCRGRAWGSATTVSVVSMVHSAAASLKIINKKNM